MVSKVIPHKPKLYNWILAELIGDTILDSNVVLPSCPSKEDKEPNTLSLFWKKVGIFIPSITTGEIVDIKGNKINSVDIRVQSADRSLFVYLPNEDKPIAILGIKTPAGLVDWYDEDSFGRVMLDKFWQ